MKSLTRIATDGYTPLRYLYQQGCTWESMRAAYFSATGDATRMMDAESRARHYEEQWAVLPETAHLSRIQQRFR